MSTSGSDAPGYRIGWTDTAQAELNRLARVAVATGRKEAVRLAMRTVMARLAADPRTFGEQLYLLSTLRLMVRSAVQAPLYVEYGVHEDRPFVIVRHVGLLSSVTR